MAVVNGRGTFIIVNQSEDSNHGLGLGSSQFSSASQSVNQSISQAASQPVSQSLYQGGTCSCVEALLMNAYARSKIPRVALDVL